MIKKKDLSKEDKENWENYIKDPSDLYDKDLNNSTNETGKERFKFDLHGFTLDEANSKVRDLIIACSENKYKEILLITGKGIHSTSSKDIYVSKDFSKLKFSVPEFIKSNRELNKLVTSVQEAKPKDGGNGAIIVRLKSL